MRTNPLLPLPLALALALALALTLTPSPSPNPKQVSAMRGKIAVVDDSSVVTVYDLKSGKVLFAEPHASSVAWNAELDDMLCFSGNGTLSIKTANFPLHQQRMRSGLGLTLPLPLPLLLPLPLSLTRASWSASRAQDLLAALRRDAGEPSWRTLDGPNPTPNPQPPTPMLLPLP